MSHTHKHDVHFLTFAEHRLVSSAWGFVSCLLSFISSLLVFAPCRRQERFEEGSKEFVYSPGGC